LGQSQDHSALAVVERADLILDEIDHATYERLKERRYRVRFLERVALGTYPNVVERVRAVVRAKAAGGPVHPGDGRDWSWGAGDGHAAAGTIGLADRAPDSDGRRVGVPRRGRLVGTKQDLVAGLRVMLEKRELGLPAKLGGRACW
jgi:hypothetical protein